MKATTVFPLLISVLIGVWETTDSKGCTNGFQTFGKSCYLLTTSTIGTWANAVVYCASFQADLVTINSAAEDSYLRDHAKRSKPELDGFWVGANDIQLEGHWMWSSGHLPYTNWAPKQPDNGNNTEHCLELSTAYNYFWNDSDCTTKKRFICELNLS